MAKPQRISTCIWMNNQAEEAANFIATLDAAFRGI